MSVVAGRLQAYSYREYLQFESSNPARHEFVDGCILAMAGGTPTHASLQTAMLFALERRFGGSACHAFPSDLRVKVAATGMATYPDVTVVCGAVQTAPDDLLAVLNPVLIAEVLSDSTIAYDRGQKFEHYREIPALQHYVLVSHRERRIELREREPDGTWSERHASRGERLALKAIDIELTVDEIYDRSDLTRSL